MCFIVILIELSLLLCPGSTVWELLVQGIWSGSVQCAQTNCEGHGFAPAACFASAGETEPTPGRQTTCQFFSKHLQPSNFWYSVVESVSDRVMHLLHDSTSNIDI